MLCSSKPYLKSELNELKQYSRQNSLRIRNPHWTESPYENTDDLILELADKLGLNFQPWLIDRSHRVGKPIRGKSRDILIKFIGYGPRKALYEARQQLREQPRFRNIYINEDLSPETSRLFYQARILKKENRLDARRQDPC